MATPQIASVFITALACVIPGAAAQTKPKYILETYVVFDIHVMSNYARENSQTPGQELFHDAEFFFTFTNEILKTMNKYGLDIEMRIINIDLPMEDILLDRQTQRYRLTGAGSVNMFIQWQIDNQLRDRFSYDVALLYTGLDLHVSTGAATSGSICRLLTEGIYASSVITFRTMSTAVTTAHELAHILGAYHEGMASYHTMRADISFFDANRFSFSQCTVNDILAFFETIDTGCMLDGEGAFLTNVPVEKYVGKLRDGHTVCRRVYGETSSVCSVKGFENQSCLGFFCKIESSDGSHDCWSVQTTEGMPCDKDKICRLGNCVNDPFGIAKDTIPGCMFGDAPEVTLGNERMPCEDAYELVGGDLCTGDNTQCCATCDKRRRKLSIPGCFGDHKTVDISKKSKGDCSRAVSRLGEREVCKNRKSLAKQCCETCRRIKGNPDCPFEELGVFGNSKKFIECKDLSDLQCEKAVVAKKCCKRCAELLDKH